MNDLAFSRDLSVESLRRIEIACTKFEAGCREEDRDIELLLAGSHGNERSALLCELAALDIELRRGRGESPGADEYLRFADDSADTAALKQHIATLLSRSSDEPGPEQHEPDRDPPGGGSTRYDFLERVGSGGVSDVWRVFDRRGQRPVAIKLLQRRFQRDTDAQSRLQREALLTGSLQHPGIPPVYDHGHLDDGNFFFAMKLVQGDTLENMLKGRDPTASDLSDYLGIFEQIAQTLAYAHANDIIHRDVKPQNVMVGRFGEVQVMDWGMAKRFSSSDITSEPLLPTEGDHSPIASMPRVDQRQLEDTARSSLDSSWIEARHSLTAAGDVLGTPSYMAPEQARGAVEAIDQRSDVFGLGAILFEILTGQRLHREGSVAEVLTRVAAGDFADSLDVLHRSSADQELLSLCERCLSMDREGRPADASEVADGITHYLAGFQDRLKQAELDRREAVVRAGEESKRRRWISSMAAAIATVSIIGTAGVIWQWRESVDANAKANRALLLADRRLDQAQAVVDEYLTEIAKPDGVLNRSPGTQSLRRLLLEKARDYYQQFLSESGDNPTVQYEAARAYARLGEIAQVLDPGGEETFEMYAEAIKLYQQLIDQDATVAEYHRGLAEAQGAIGNAHFAASRFDQAIDSYSKSAEVWTDLSLKHPEPQHALGLAKSTHNIGHAKSQVGDKEGAEPFLERALELVQPLLEAHGEDPEFLFAISNMYSNAGTFFGFKRGQWKRSLELYETSVLLRESLAALDPTQHRFRNALAGGYNNVGLALYQAKKIDEAYEAFQRAAAIREKLVKDFPSIAQYAKELGDTYTNLGTFSVKQGRPQESVEYYEKSVGQFKRLADAHPQIIAYPKEAIDCLVSIAQIEPFTAKGGDAVRMTTEFYSQLLAVRPDSRNYRRLLAFYSAFLSDVEPAALLELTQPFAIELNPDHRELTVRALVHYRNGQVQDAAEHLQAIPVEQSDHVVELLTVMVLADRDDERALNQYAKAKREIAKKEYPAFEIRVLSREAESRLEAMADRKASRESKQASQDD